VQGLPADPPSTPWGATSLRFREEGARRIWTTLELLPARSSLARLRGFESPAAAGFGEGSILTVQGRRFLRPGRSLPEVSAGTSLTAVTEHVDFLPAAVVLTSDKCPECGEAEATEDLHHHSEQ
jgi:hypothetical protein